MAKTILRSALELLTMPQGGDDFLPFKRYRLGQLPTYEILAKDFDRIGDEAQSIGTAFAFATACIPVALTLTVALTTVIIDSWKVKAPFMVLMFVCYILGLYFSVLAFRQRGRLTKFMQAIRDSQVAPLGEKGDEIGPAESQQLQSEAADSSAPSPEEKV
jgi:hypothetical protein